MTDSPIKTTTRGHVLEVTLDRPKANAIDLKTSRIMGEVFRDFRDDDNLRAAIITGGGDKFFWCFKRSTINSGEKAVGYDISTIFFFLGAGKQR